MSKPATAAAVPAEIECPKQEHRDILTSCQAVIFRDIWRLTNADVALKMFFTLQRALPDDLDRSDTPTLNALASRLREAPDILHYLEFSIQNPSIVFPLLQFQEEHNRCATEEANQKGGAQA